MTDTKKVTDFKLNGTDFQVVKFGENDFALQGDGGSIRGSAEESQNITIHKCY